MSVRQLGCRGDGGGQVDPCHKGPGAGPAPVPPSGTQISRRTDLTPAGAELVPYPEGHLAGALWLSARAVSTVQGPGTDGYQLRCLSVVYQWFPDWVP